jgi:cytidylate kinase
MNPNVVTIDGPAAGGKSTTSRRLAERIDALYLDSGATYRAMTLAAIRRGVAWSDAASLGRLAEAIDIRFRGRPTAQTVYLDGDDVTSEIRSIDVTRQIHHVARTSEVRRALRVLQREIASRHRRVVAEGRDMGTVVFPDAVCKVYLDASVEERARRRLAEETARGVAIDFETIKRDIVERDRTDFERDDSPLRVPGDAVVLDTTGLTVEEVVDRLVVVVEPKLSDSPQPDSAQTDHVV